MKTPRTLILLLASAFSFLLASGCSTPETRIRKNPDAFARLAPAQQELIKKGQIAVGFDETMVLLALGDPDRKRMRHDADGTTEIWIYWRWNNADGMPLHASWYHRGWGDHFYPHYMDYPPRHEREQMRVLFRGGKVTAFENETP